MISDDTPMPEPTFALTRSDTELARVVVGDSAAPLVEVELNQEADTKLARPMQLSAEQRTAVSALLAQLPSLIQSSHTALIQTYRLTFKPEAIAKMANLIQARGGGIHAVGVDRHGQIVGQGILKSTNGAPTLAGLTAIWQGFTIITAQIHLAEINNRLARIEQGITTIKAWLEAEQLAKLEVGLRYVREASVALTHQSLSEAERTRLADQLEPIWRECGQVAQGALQMLQHAPAEFSTVELSAWYWLDESADLASAALAEYQRRAHTYLLATYVRAAIVALRTPLGLNSAVSAMRLDELCRDIVDWRNQRDAYFQTFKRRVHTELWGTFNSHQTISATRRKLLAAARRTRLDLNEMCDGIEQLTNHTRAVSANNAGAGETLCLTVTVDQHRQITEIHRVTIPRREEALRLHKVWRDDAMLSSLE